MGTFETTTDHQTEVSKFHSSYIKMIENWRSDAYLIYLEFLLETCTATSELMKMIILALEKKREGMAQ